MRVRGEGPIESSGYLANRVRTYGGEGAWCELEGGERSGRGQEGPAISSVSPPISLNLPPQIRAAALVPRRGEGGGVEGEVGLEGEGVEGEGEGEGEGLLLDYSTTRGCLSVQHCRLSGSSPP